MILSRSLQFCRTGFRGLSTSHPKSISLQVLVSQSNDLVANVALEEWMKRCSTHRTNNLLLLLSSNTIVHNNYKSIHAFFSGEDERGKTLSTDQLAQQANLVFSALPKDTALVELPMVRVAAEENGKGNNLLISLPLDSHVDDDVLKTTLQCIANSFVQKCRGGDGGYSLSRISLVRPDGGWFPGIQEIQRDVQLSLKEIEAIKLDKANGKPKTNG
eukprot:TRINITY_DN3421_c0_g1_i12.p1 TRINITY_DN3421_c0_g1~~TRINITY_DN3421_c0_g1_i12.p1  ORF type:complete len:216 (+),score=44.16 TRINITY_DN3421_c0_g1_i12:254-901(+)